MNQVFTKIPSKVKFSGLCYLVKDFLDCSRWIEVLMAQTEKYLGRMGN